MSLGHLLNFFFSPVLIGSQKIRRGATSAQQSAGSQSRIVRHKGHPPVPVSIEFFKALVLPYLFEVRSVCQVLPVLHLSSERVRLIRRTEPLSSPLLLTVVFSARLSPARDALSLLQSYSSLAPPSLSAVRSWQDLHRKHIRVSIQTCVK